jgi:aminopeptidase
MAQVLVEYSLGVQPGDHVLVHAPTLAAPLVEQVYRHLLHVGAHPIVRLGLPHLTELALREASEVQLNALVMLDCDEVDRVAALLVIDAPENVKGLANADPHRLATWHAARARLMGRCIARITDGGLRWCHTVFPTNAHAQQAGMSLAEYEEFVFRAALLDGDDPILAWRRLHTRQQAIVDFLTSCGELHIVGPGVDLRCNVRGRTWINGSGAFNFPDGEVFTSPIESSVSGTIAFTFPAVYKQTVVHDVVLTFEEGRVVDWSASSNHAFLTAMLDTDEGARFVGEIAFGLNARVQRFTGNTLFDEKLAGTMHLALGRSYPRTGGTNRSAIHWDMVTRLQEGRVDADGEPCYVAGDFVSVLPRRSIAAAEPPGADPQTGVSQTPSAGRSADRERERSEVVRSSH